MCKHICLCLYYATLQYSIFQLYVYIMVGSFSLFKQTPGGLRLIYQGDYFPLPDWIKMFSSEPFIILRL